jgi:hypothetical protein
MIDRLHVTSNHIAISAVFDDGISVRSRDEDTFEA